MEYYEIDSLVVELSLFVDFFSEMAAKESELLLYGMKRATKWESYKKVQPLFEDFDSKILELLRLARPIDKELQNSMHQLIDDGQLPDLMGKMNIQLKIAESQSSLDNTSGILRELMFSFKIIGNSLQKKRLFTEEQLSIQSILVVLNRLISHIRTLQKIYINGWSSDDEVFKPSNIESEKIIVLIENAIINIQESTQLSPDQRKELTEYLHKAKTELASDRPSWNKIVGALVIVATVMSGIADAPQTIENVNAAIKYILGTSVERHIPRPPSLLPRPATIDPEEAMG